MLPGDVLSAIAAEAGRGLALPIDRAVYQAAGRDARVPIVFAGSFSARICVFGRDLGAGEVRHAQPLVGPSGRLVRAGVLAALGRPERTDDPLLEDALEQVLLVNAVPYKPEGNRPFPVRVRERFRAHLERLLVSCWRGDTILTLGADALGWFDRYAAPGAVGELWGRDDCFQCNLAVRLTAEIDGGTRGREVTLCPLPHPSPANARFRAQFPRLLQNRLRAVSH